MRNDQGRGKCFSGHLFVYVKLGALSITVNFTKLRSQMFRISLRCSQVRCEVQRFVRFTNQFVNDAFDWLILLQGPIRDYVYTN